MRTYTRTLDGAEMVEIAPNQYVAREIAERLGLIKREAA